MKNIMGRIREYLNRKAVRRKLRRAVSILSCIVVFGTTYALLLPALTLEAETVCGMEEHEHTEDCFSRVLICGQEESDGHQHSQECYDADGNLICGQEESEGHHHTDDCYEMQLTCDKEVHVHSEECYKHEDAPAADEADTAEIAQEEEADNGSTEGNTSESSAASTEAAAAATKEAAKETAKTAEPEKLKEIRLERFLTGRSGIYYIPENGGSDDWVELGSDDRLDPEQNVIVHIAFEIPAGKLNATNARTEYELPLSISMTEDEVRDINNYESRVFIGTDREANDLGDAGSFEIEEEYDGDGDVTERIAMIRFNADTCKLVGGEKLTDGTVTAQPESIEGFIEMTISAQDLLTLKAVGEASYVLEWNDDSSLDTYVNFDADKLQAFLDEKNGKDEEASEAETAEESAAAAATEEIAITEEEAVTEEEASEAEPVQEEAPTTSYASGKLDYDGGSYTVTASFDESAQLPEGVRLNVKELTGASYQKYLSEANEAVGEKKEVTGGRFFDITFTDAEGKPVEPQGMVDVCITYKNTETIEEGTSVEGVHFTDEGAQTIDVDAKGVAENTVDVVGFTSDSFSVYGVVYTVDFEYTDPITGEVYYYTLKGGKSISLTDLLMVMGVKSKDAAIEFVANQVENVEFSAPELVKVTHNGKILGIFGKEDWVLESLQPFDTQETLTITLKNGAAIIVKVTDEQEGVWDLADSGNVDFLHVTADSSVTETEQERDAAFRLNVSYGLKEDVVKAIDAYTGNPVTLVYDISSTLANSPLKDEIRCKGTISIGNRKLGTYREENGKIYLEFTDTAYFNDKTSFTGYFQLTVQTDERELGDSDEYTYEFPGTSDTVPIHYKKTVEEGSKTVSDNKDADGNYTLHYTANVNVNSDLNTLTFNDTLGGLQTLDASSVKINGRPVTVSQSGKNFSFDVGTALGTSGVAKGSYQVTYDTKLTAEQLSQMSGDKTTETNVVTWKVNGSKDVPGGQTEREYHKPHETVPVSKVITDGRTTHNPGDTISYQITYGDSNTDLAGFEIYDSMTDLQTLQGGITISYNGTTTTMPSSAIVPADSTYSTNMVTLFDYTFPDNTQGKGPVVVTYTTKVIDADTAKANGIYDTKELSNLAQEKRYDTTDIVKTNVPFEKEKQVTVDKTAQAAPTDESGSWVPGSKINYTLTVGDANTDMSGVHIWDEMTDLQTLEGTVKIKVGNGSVINLTDYIANAMTYEDDGQYSSNNVKLFDFVMPNNCGNGPVVITYTTKVISDDTANANGIYGDAIIKNTGHGGPGSDGTEGPVIFGEYPIDKEVTQNGTDVNGQTVDMDSTVHYKLTLGDQHTNLKGAVIYDEMTDIQKVVSSITITKANGDSFTMPSSSGKWQGNGFEWSYWDDGVYNANTTVRVFQYTLPDDIGYGPIIIEYDAQIISVDEANESGISGDQIAYNIFKHNNHFATTNVKIEFPKNPEHNPKVTKEFNNKWDASNNTLYWDIIVEKTEDSAYPLENVSVRENFGGYSIYIINEDLQVWNREIRLDDAGCFDLMNAVVTTDGGTVLTPGTDYTINRSNAEFIFPVLNERVRIELPFHSPVDITNGYKMHNSVIVNDTQKSEAEAVYDNPKVEVSKTGSYTEEDRLFKWTVVMNPSKKPFDDSDPIRVMFEDQIPEGLTLVNYDAPSDTTKPGSIKVSYDGVISGYSQKLDVSVDSTNKIGPVDVAGHGIWGDRETGLDRERITVEYYTKLSDEEWDKITSSASGSGTYENKVHIEAGDNQEFDASDKVTVTEDEYLEKSDDTQETGGIVVDTEGEPSKNISYSVKINPKEHMLNNNEPLSLTDYISTNMDLEPKSVKIVNAETGQEESDVEISYNDDSRLLRVTNIPDQKYLLLTYTCYARAQGIDEFTNTATLIGGGSHSSSVTEKHNIQTNDAGVGVDGIQFSLYKIDENEISKPLGGAQFQLYKCELEIGDLTSIENYPQSYWDALLEKMNRINAGGGSETEITDIKNQFRITGYTPVEGPKTTEGSGAGQGFVDWRALSEHTLYAWKEVGFPDNYTGNDEYHYFVGYQHINVNSDLIPQPLLSEEEQLNRKKAAWALDDAVQLANDVRVASMSNLTTWTATNIESKYTWISATKVWEGDSDNLFETRPTDGIKLQLVRINADGTTENVGSKVAINADSSGNWPSYLWDKLPAEDADGNKLKYTVVEDLVKDYSTEYSDNAEGIEMGEITVTNKMIPKNTNIFVEKAFDQDGDLKPDGIRVSLLVIRKDLEGNVSDPEETGEEVVLSTSNDWKWCFEKLPTKEVGEDGKAYYLSYTVVEDLAAVERQGFKYTVTYSDDGKGVLENTEDEPLLITNTAPRNGSLYITKKAAVNGTVIGDTTAQDVKSIADGTYTFTITKKDDAEFEPRTVQLTISGGVAAESDEITDLPAGTYVITENPVMGTELIDAEVCGKDAAITSNAVEVEVVAGKVGSEAPIVSFTNNVTKIDFTKKWKNGENGLKWPEDKSITVEVSDGTNTYNYTITSNDLTQGQTISGQNEGDPVLIVKAVTEDDTAMNYVYEFEIKGLPYNNGSTYIVTEQKVEGYKDPIYKLGLVDTTEGARDGGTIVNITEESYILPHTGGFGITPLYTIGLLLITLAAGLYTYLNRKNLISMRSDHRSRGAGHGNNRGRGGGGL